MTMVASFQQTPSHTFSDNHIVWLVFHEEHGVFNFICLLRVEMLEHAVVMNTFVGNNTLIQ